MRKLFAMQFENQSMKDKEDSEKLDENVTKMQENMDIMISEKQDKDLLSGSFDRYTKAMSE